MPQYIMGNSYSSKQIGIEVLNQAIVINSQYSCVHSTLKRGAIVQETPGSQIGGDSVDVKRCCSFTTLCKLH